MLHVLWQAQLFIASCCLSMDQFFFFLGEFIDLVVALFWFIMCEHSDKGSFILHALSLKFRFFSEEFGFVSP